MSNSGETSENVEEFDYRKYMNQYHVIYINFIKPSSLSKSYADFIGRVEKTMTKDLHREFSTVDFWENASPLEDLSVIYEDGKVHIPNRELMDEFAKTIREKENLGYIYNLAVASDRMLQATLKSDTKTMEEILQFAHDTETPLLDYNNETELTAVVNLVYLSARDIYYVERKNKAGKGYVDFIFYPEQPGDDGLILELKVDDTPEAAIRQIKDRKYVLKFQGKMAEKKQHTGRILLAGIGYDKKKKEHHCKIEIL